MSHETEVIRRQMDGTRADLTNKLESLEHQVTDTVTAATETVGSVRDAVQETVAGLKESVQDTVASVKGTMHETIESVKDSLDINAQVARSPWLCVGASIAAGYVAGSLLDSRDDSGERMADISSRGNGWQERSTAASIQSLTGKGSSGQAARSNNAPGMFSNLMREYEPEINQLKGLAVGALVGLVRDSVLQSVPSNLRPQFSDVINSFSAKLKGDSTAGAPPRQPFFTAHKHDGPAPNPEVGPMGAPREV